MPTVTLEFRFKLSGVLTNVTSVLLSDPTGTYGVKRMDTAVTVVADGVAMTNISTGVYRHTFTAPAPGLEYSWWAEVLYAGTTYRFEREHRDVVSSASATYADQSDLEDRWGAQNILHWSNLDPSATITDATRVQLALDYADNEIDLYFGNVYVAPFAGYSVGDATAIKLREWAVVLAGKWLYSARGTQDDNSFGDKLTDEFERTMDEMALYRGGVKSFSATRHTLHESFIPVAHDA